MPDEQLYGSEEHEVTEREKRLYQEKKDRTRTPVRELTDDETIEFCTLLLEGRAVDMEARLDLSRVDVEEVKARLDITVPEDARPIRARLLRLREFASEGSVITSQEAKAEQMERQKRQDAADAARRAEARKTTRTAPDPAAAKREWRDREARVHEEETPEESEWRLPGAEDDNSDFWDTAIIDRFRHDIQTRGMQFTMSKYDCEASDIRAESVRLGLGISDWSMVRR